MQGQGEKSERIFRLAYLNASLQTGLVNPLDEAITTQGDPGTGGVTKLAEIPYDFIRKRLTVVVAENDQTRIIFSPCVTRFGLAMVLSPWMTALSKPSVNVLPIGAHRDSVC